MANGDEFASFPPEYADAGGLTSFEDPDVLAEQKAARDMLSYLKDQEDMGNFMGAGQLISDEFTSADLDAAKAMQAEKMGISVAELERQQALVNRFNQLSDVQKKIASNPQYSRELGEARTLLRLNPDIMTGFSEDYLPGGMSTENPLELQRARDRIIDENAIETMQGQQEAQDQLSLAEIRAMDICRANLSLTRPGCWTLPAM